MRHFILSFLAVILTGGGALQAATYTIDPVHSTVLFKVKHSGVSNAYGRFNEFSGEIQYDPEDIDATSISFAVIASSVDTADGDRDRHLRGPDFFNTKQFPEITFSSDEVKQTGENQFEITGELTLLGKKSTLTAPFTFLGSGKNHQGKEVAGGEATFRIVRSEFGMTYGLQGIGDEVEIVVSIEALKK